MSHAEHFCGIATGGWPTTGVGSPCSHTSPRWYQVYGLGLNPLNKRAYVVDVDGYTVTSVPIPDLSTGNVELVAGPLGCGSRAVCRGTTTGSFAGTRINYGQGILMSAQLLPKFYLAEYGNYRLLELDLSTQTSSIYVGTNSMGSNADANDFNNVVRTSAVMCGVFDAAATSDYILPSHNSYYQPKVSRTTDVVTLLIELSYACNTNAHYNGIVYCSSWGTAVVTSFTVPGGVDNGAITGGAFAPSDTGMTVNIDAELKVLWIGADMNVYKYDIMTGVATLISGLSTAGSTGDGPMPSTSYGWAVNPYEMVRYGELLVVSAGSLHRLRVLPPITYTLGMDHAEHFCGIDTHTLPTSGVSSPCSLSSPRWYQVYGLGLNPLNKLAYVVDTNGGTVTSVPIPDLSRGNVELVAGVIGCVSDVACRGTATGAFAETRFYGGVGMLMDAQLLPKFYVGENGNCRLLELDLSTQTSSIYIGTNSMGSRDNANGFNNVVRTSAVMCGVFDAAATSDYILPSHNSYYQPKVSRTTDMVTLLAVVGHIFGCDTNAHYNGIVYCACLGCGPTWGIGAIISFTVPGGVANGAISGGAFTPGFGMGVNIDAELKVLWIGAHENVYKYDITTGVATLISGLETAGSTGDGPMPSTSYGWAVNPYQMVRYGELLVIAAGGLHRLRVRVLGPTDTATTSRTTTDTATDTRMDTATDTKTPTLSHLVTLSFSGTLSTFVSRSGESDTYTSSFPSPTFSLSQVSSDTLLFSRTSSGSLFASAETLSLTISATLSRSATQASRSVSRKYSLTVSLTPSHSHGTALQTWTVSISLSAASASRSESSRSFSEATLSDVGTGTSSVQLSQSSTLSRTHTLWWSATRSHSHNTMTSPASQTWPSSKSPPGTVSLSTSVDGSATMSQTTVSPRL